MKKKLSRILIYSFSLVLLVNTSCEKFVGGVSEIDPTRPIDASTGQVLNAGELGVVAFSEGDLARLAGIFTDQFTGVDRQYFSLNNYTTTAGDYDSQWDNIYGDALKSLRIARSKSEVTNNLRAKALTQILEAYLMGTTAALFGDIPFSQAANIEQYPNPAYDTQADVYAGVLALLDDAISNIANAPAGTGYDGDFFGGDDAVWTARANTLKAKFLLHLGRYADAAAAAQAGISSSADDLMAPHGPSYGQNFNIYYSFLSYDRPGYMSADFALAPHLLDPGLVDGTAYRGNAKTDETARFYWYYYPEGLNSGVEEYDINVLWSDDWGNDPSEDGFFSAINSFPILTFAENQLILAEALVRTGDDAGALDALNSWRQELAGGYRISPAYQGEGLQYDDYDLLDFAPVVGIENPDGISASDALYREIIEEKYVSLVGTLEVFTDMRRKAFGSFAGEQNWQMLGVTANTGSEIPQRFLIPQTELNANTSAPGTPPGLFEKTALFQ
jgi:hypothetical protein